MKNLNLIIENSKKTTKNCTHYEILVALQPNQLWFLFFFSLSLSCSLCILCFCVTGTFCFLIKKITRNKTNFYVYFNRWFFVVLERFHLNRMKMHRATAANKYGDESNRQLIFVPLLIADCVCMTLFSYPTW